MKYFKIEFLRAIREKKFIYIIIFMVLMSIIITAPNFLPNQISYWYSDCDVKLAINPILVWKGFLNSRLMTTFIVLFPILIYTHSYIDDIQYRYINNIAIKINFITYYKNKLQVCMLLGGSLFFIQSIVSYFIMTIIYSSNATYNSEYIFSFLGFNIIFTNPILYVFFISTLLFLLGMVYSTIGFFVSLFTNNKILVYSISVLSLKLYESIIYFISRILRVFLGDSSSDLYLSFSIFSDLGTYTSANVITNNIILFFIIIYCISYKIKKIEADIFSLEEG